MPVGGRKSSRRGSRCLGFSRWSRRSKASQPCNDARAMKTITIVARASAECVLVLGVFGVGGLTIGAMLVAGAAKVAAAMHGASATGIAVAGVVVIAVSLAITTGTWRQLGAVCALEIAEDSAWTVITRRGLWSVVWLACVSLVLCGFFVWLFWGA